MGRIGFKFKKFTLAVAVPLIIGLSACGGGSGKDLSLTATTALIASDTIRVEWPREDDAQYYRVYRKTSDKSDYSYITDVNENFYEDRTVTRGNKYSYKITQVIKGNEYGLAVSEDLSTSSSPKITAVDVDSKGMISVSWVRNGCTYYNIYSSPDGTNWTEECGSESFSAKFVNNEARYLAVTGVMAEGISKKIVESPIDSPVVIPGETAVRKVIKSDKYTAVLLFDPIPGAQYYEVYRSETENGAYTFMGTCVDNVYYDKTLQDAEVTGVNYCYKVCACTDIVKGRMSQPVRIGTGSSVINDVPVIMYHIVLSPEDVEKGVEFREYAIYDYEFEEDLKYLAANGYTTITAGQLADYLEGKGNLPAKPILLTFDDGAYGVYSNALPLLKRYNMIASLAIIGARIDEATANPEKRCDPSDPYCTWDEIAEMSHSGHMEIVSHSYNQHVFHHDGRTGADIMETDEEEFRSIAQGDYDAMAAACSKYGVKYEPVMSYPYSYRSPISDRAWIDAGYRMLYAGESASVSRTYSNKIVKDAGLNYSSAVLRRQVRMAGDPLSSVLKTMKNHDL